MILTALEPAYYLWYNPKKPKATDCHQYTKVRWFSATEINIYIFRFNIDQKGEILLLNWRDEASKVSIFVKSELDIRYFE